MASITIPTPIQTTSATIGGYIYNSNNSDLQALFNNDTDITCDGKYMYYKDVPIFCNGGNNSNYLMMAVKYGQSGQSSNTALFGYSSDTCYIYDFNTFYYIAGHKVITDVSATVQRSAVIIDKTNSEVFDGFRYYTSGYGFGYRGLMFNYLENQQPVLSSYYPNESSGEEDTDFTAIRREESVENATYVKLSSLNGKQATRMYFFTKFPRGSSNQVLHIGDKYFYLFPICETTRTYTIYDESHTSSTRTQEIWCTLGIDVTSEINAQP